MSLVKNLKRTHLLLLCLVIFLILPGIIFAQENVSKNQALKNIQEQIIKIQKLIDELQKQINLLIAQVSINTLSSLITVAQTQKTLSESNSKNIKSDIGLILENLNTIKTNLTRENYNKYQLLSDLEIITDLSKQLSKNTLTSNSLDSAWKLWVIHYDLITLGYEQKNNDELDKKHTKKEINRQIKNTEEALSWLNQNNIYKSKEELVNFITFPE